jgi:hypothetical protein
MHELVHAIYSRLYEEQEEEILVDGDVNMYDDHSRLQGIDWKGPRGNVIRQWKCFISFSELH